MTFTIKYRSSVKKELRRISKIDRKAVIDRIETLKNNPKPVGSAKLKGSRDLYRVRQGDFRVIYKIENDVLVIIIIRIGHRRDIYKNL